jgi:DNA-binding NtrC family response regulator
MKESSVKSRRIVIRHPRKKEPLLWVIDSEQWPRALLRAELIERGYDPCGFITIDDAFDSLSRPGSAKPELIILELRAQNVTRQLIAGIRNLGIPTIVMGGSAELNDPLVQQQWTIILKRPISLGKIADVVQKIISEERRVA